MVAALSNHASTSWSASSPASKSWKCGAQNSHLSRRERVGGGGCRGGAGEGQWRERGGDATGRAGGVGKRGMFGVAGVGCASSRTSPPSRTSWRTRHRGDAASSCCCNDSLLRFNRETRAPPDPSRCTRGRYSRARPLACSCDTPACDECVSSRPACARVCPAAAPRPRPCFQLRCFQVRSATRRFFRGERWILCWPTVCRRFKIPDRGAFFFFLFFSHLYWLEHTFSRRARRDASREERARSRFEHLRGCLTGVEAPTPSFRRFHDKKRATRLKKWLTPAHADVDARRLR